MRKLLAVVLVVPVITILIFYSCRKEYSCEKCVPVNQPPVANAGKDTSIVLPNNIVILDGSNSTDPDNNIVSYSWTKISGPASFNITNNTAEQTQVNNLIEGIYQFELKVTDAGGLSDKDTVQIEVRPNLNQQNLINVIFYWPEPTGTVNFIFDNNSHDWMTWDTAGMNLNLVTVMIDSLADHLAGVYCQSCLPDCIAAYYTSIFGDKNIVTFKLPPGSYKWSAVSTINPFPSPYNINPNLTPELYNFFNTPHTLNGTVTVNPGDSCVIQKIIFQ